MRSTRSEVSDLKRADPLITLEKLNNYLTLAMSDGKFCILSQRRNETNTESNSILQLAFREFNQVAMNPMVPILDGNS